LPPSLTTRVGGPRITRVFPRKVSEPRFFPSLKLASAYEIRLWTAASKPFPRAALYAAMNFSASSSEATWCHRARSSCVRKYASAELAQSLYLESPAPKHGRIARAERRQRERSLAVRIEAS